MRRVGFHTSITGGIHRSIERAESLGCNTLQIFSHNPRGWSVKGLSVDEIDKFKYLRKKYDISPVFIHTCYLINLASANKVIRRKSIEMLAVEMERADAIGADYVILHTGSATGEIPSYAIKIAIDALNEVTKRGKWKAGLIVENTSGKQGDISSRIYEMAEIINGIKKALIGGICIDTCHAFASGYDISVKKGIKKISCEVEKYIGLKNLKLIHLNDSKGSLGSGIDRHEHIGKGKIGMKGLEKFINYPPFKNVPIILETPKKKEEDDIMNFRIVKAIIE